MTKYYRKCRRIGSMAKTSNVARRRIKKRTTRKKRGGGCVNSTCTSEPIEVNASLEADFLIAMNKVVRFLDSEIIKNLKNEHAVKANRLVDIIMPISNDYRYNNLNKFVYFQRFLEAYNNFRIQEPEFSRILDLPDDIMKLEFADDKFHDRDEVINYLLEKEPAIFNFLKEDALNESLDKIKLKSQDMPESQELGGGRRKKTTRKQRGGGGCYSKIGCLESNSDDDDNDRDYVRRILEMRRNTSNSSDIERERERQQVEEEENLRKRRKTEGGRRNKTTKKRKNIRKRKTSKK